MKKEDDWNLIDLGGSSEYSLEEVKESGNNLKVITGLFFLKVSERARNYINDRGEKGLINSGAMLSNDNFKSSIRVDDLKTEIDMYMTYYADYINKGVMGYLSKKPESPYKFRNLGMSAEGRKNILRSVTEGKMKVSDTSKTKYGRIGLETKAKKTPNQQELNEREAARIAYLIKAYGIKTTNFINDGWNDFVKEIGPDLPKLLAPYVIANLKKVNK